MILDQRALDIFEELFSCRTNEHAEAYPNSAIGVSPKNEDKMETEKQEKHQYLKKKREVEKVHSTYAKEG